ncbi:MAG: flagellin, partial [Thiohalomonadaceae bacterium]
VNRAIGNIDLAMDNILTVRASVGARLKAIDSQTYVNDGYLVQAQETLSSVEDLDYAEAISRLHMQLTGLEAAQQTYLKVNGLSMFNYLR